jgi:hypothetical protein
VLADGLGLTGSLEDLGDLCRALISQDAPLQVARPLMPGLFIQQPDKADPAAHLEFTRLLRQLVWLRDLGLSCGVTELSRPWRQLADEIRAGF